MHPRLWNRAGRQAVQAGKSGLECRPFATTKKKKTTWLSLVTPLVGILHLTLCSVTSHACRPRLWTPNHKSRIKLSGVEWSRIELSRVELSRVESSRVEPAIYYSSQELNYGLLVAPFCTVKCVLEHSPWQSRALALADILSAVRLDACNACTDPSCCWRPNSGGCIH